MLDFAWDFNLHTWITLDRRIYIMNMVEDLKKTWKMLYFNSLFWKFWSGGQSGLRFDTNSLVLFF